MKKIVRENKMGHGGIHRELFFGGHGGKEWVGESGVNYGKIDFENEMTGDFETFEVKNFKHLQTELGYYTTGDAKGFPDANMFRLLSRWYGVSRRGSKPVNFEPENNPEDSYELYKRSVEVVGKLIIKIPMIIYKNVPDRGRDDDQINESIKKFKKLIR